jgi:RNA 3'-terminal phosphate cyclase (ATP)
MLQTLMIPLPFLKYSLEISLRGGTHVPWSPPMDYLQNVTVPLLIEMGYSCDLEIVEPGFYPKGGGRAILRSTPVRGLRSISLDDFGDLERINGVSRASNLPEHVARRQASSAMKALSSISRPQIEISVERALCPGSAITIWASTSTGCLLGASALGKRGLPAEEVGRRAGEEMRSYIAARSPVDPHLIDQIIPYAALAAGKTILRGHQFTMHTETNIHVVKKFVDCEIEVEGDLDGPCRVAIEGIGLDGE